MRDLDIRGAGNLLGAEQSGFIAEIGFEMYHKILDEAIQELKEEEFKDLFKDEKPKPYISFTQVRSEEHTSELQSLMRISYAVFCLKKKISETTLTTKYTQQTHN